MGLAWEIRKGDRENETVVTAILPVIFSKVAGAVSALFCKEQQDPWFNKACSVLPESEEAQQAWKCVVFFMEQRKTLGAEISTKKRNDRMEAVHFICRDCIIHCLELHFFAYYSLRIQ
jgi:hypothetical protein